MTPSARGTSFHPLLLASFLLSLQTAAATAAESPNIVVILADDLGWSDTAPYGSEIRTPAISALAEEGIQFTNYHTAASCAPTRGMLLTGVDSHRNGVPNIPEAIPPAQSEHTNYRGTLSHGVVTIATLLRDAGYHTYMAGKWHLGMSPDLLPSARGFERTVAMADTGADNWEQKPYLPIYDKANWFADGEETTLPPDFYSSRFFVDKMIEFVESNREDGRPFLAYLPFQAVHIPVQAPQEFTDGYLGRYDAGWTALRQARHERAIALGLVPAESKMIAASTTADWDAQSPEEKRYASKQMAVYAGMVEAMDHHIGRFVAYLQQTGAYDDTVFIFASDNGSEGSDPLQGLSGAYMQLWFTRNGYDTDYDTLGLRGSFNVIGPSFASAAAAPLAYYKFFAREGGMRVPLIVSGAPVAAPGSVSNAFAYVTDLAPTLLSLAGVSAPASRYAGREVEPISGRNLLPLIEGSAHRVYGPDDPVGYELAGNAALFKGDFKIVRDRGPIGDDAWHLFDVAADPGETVDLKGEMPDRFAAMMRDYEAYAARNDVQPVPDGYDQRREVALNGLRNRVGRGPPLVAAAVVLLVVLMGVRRIARRHRSAPAQR